MTFETNNIMRRYIINQVKISEKETEKARKLAEKQASIPLGKRITYLFTRTSTSLYIDDDSIKLLRVKKDRIEEWSTMPVQQGLIEHGVILNPEIIADGINTLLQQLKTVNKNKIRVCLTGLNCLTKVITIPTVPQSTMDEAVRREAERELPMPLNEVYLSWQVIQHSDQKSQIYLIAQSRIVVDALMETLRLAEIKPYILGLVPFSLARIANEKTCMIIDVKPSEADLTIVEAGIPTLLRSLPFARNKSTTEKLPILLEEIKRNLKFYGSKSKGKEIISGLPVFVTGEFDGNVNLIEAVSRELKYEASPLSTPMIYPAGFNALNYMANIGMLTDGAIKDGEIDSATFIDVNLLPQVYRTQLPFKLSAGFTTIIILALLIGFIVFHITNIMADMRVKQVEVATVNNVLEEITLAREQQLTMISELNSNILDSQKLRDSLTKTITMLADERTDIESIMFLIEQGFITRGQLETFNYAGGSLKLSGILPLEEDVLSYISELGAIYPPSQITILDMTRGDDNLIHFNLNVNIRG